MKTRTPLLTVVAVFLAAVCSAPVWCNAAEHTKEPIDVVKKNIDDGKAVLIDVREQREWDQGHLEQAKLKPLSKLVKPDAAPAALMKDVPKDKIIYCHCKSGGRAKLACDILKDLGYDVRALKPGFADLLEAGFPKAKQDDSSPEKPTK